MDILENRDQWLTAYRNGFLSHYQHAGTLDWKLYPHPRNSVAPPGPGIDVAKSRLMLISSAGGYLPGRQQPFDAAHLLGDYSIRTFPTSTSLDALSFAHDHYDHTAVDQDPQVLVPLRHVQDLVVENLVGELIPSAVSFMGYQPDVSRVVDEMIPAILQVAQAERAGAALLIPT